MKQAVIYARSASPNEDSICVQIVLGKKFAADNGYTVVKVFADTNASGRSIDRPALQKLFEDTGSSWDTVIVLDRSRFFFQRALFIYKIYAETKPCRQTDHIMYRKASINFL